MMFGITLRTASDARPFWQLVDRASAFESSPSIRPLGYPPHITLTRYSKRPSHLLIGAGRAFQREAPLSLTFDRIGMFDTDPIVLWLAPRWDQRLIDLHAKAHEIVDPALCDPHYRPQQWTPHLSIAVSVATAQRSQALAFAAQPFEPFGITFDAIECVAWPPVRILGTFRL
ncbi:2'-5' RNA ligase family protein [Bosea sp. 685]|uniref:2'-5' RNA ligase family protein n=1 Tax=Bosea sp. 685 TaxID=3080057 RepID=UPI0028935A95|nr:2'-5' RNA ligase family protein [Bosea sp. 685]WNJ88491.1 2'-5' RNA ligase family protein [Bosea sp. 685]